MHVAQERMFGLGGEYHYFECGRCGCLQLTNPPGDLSPFYPDDYLSFSTDMPATTPRGALRHWLMRRRNEAQFFGHGGFWGGVARRRPGPTPWNWSKMRLPGRHARILDVGCGRGQCLDALAAAGFEHLVGVDPFLPHDEQHGDSVRLLATGLDALAEEKFDAILFQHSLEHMPGHLGVLRCAERMLNIGGTLLVRIPLAGSTVWQRYGTEWVELDAPRHLVIHTPGSLEMVLEASGFSIAFVEYDMEGFAYWASELYRRDISLHNPQTRKRREPADYFSPVELADFDCRAMQDNRSARGGRASFYIRRKHE